MDKWTTGQYVTLWVTAVIFAGVGAMFMGGLMSVKLKALKAKIDELTAPPLEHSEVARRATRATRALRATADLIDGVVSEGQYTPDHADEIRAALAGLQPVLNNLQQATVSITAQAGRVEEASTNTK